MSFCTDCGNQLVEGARFCSRCGKPTSGAINIRRQPNSVSDMGKCPNCGDFIKAFAVRCPSCGYELRNVQGSSAVQIFARQLQEIEARRKEKSKVAGVLESIGIKCSSAIDEQEINLIRNFAVPNTREDVLEFMILAASNIDESVYNNSYNTTEKSISNAWLAKTKQVYHKAKLSLGTEPEFSEIQKIYDEKMKDVKKSKREKWGALVGCIVFFVLIIGLCSIAIVYSESKSNKLDAKLNSTVVEIQQDIIEGDYDSALVKANGLRFDPEVSEEKAKQWDEQREDLIKLIKEKKREKK